MTEEVVCIEREGMAMAGIHHRPDPAVDRRVGVLLVVAGLTYHVGLARIYVRLSRRLCNMGFHVLRFDPHGVGDSDGELPYSKMVELFRHIEEGCFVEDTLTAFDMFVERAGLRSIVLAGFCGGAVTSLLAAPRRLDKVSALALAGPTVLFQGSESERVASMTSESARELRLGYLRKLFSIRAWLRLLSARSNLRQLVKSFLLPLRRDRYAQSLEDVLAKVPNFNLPLARCYGEVAQKKVPVLFAFGERAKDRTEFEEFFQSSVLGPSSPFSNSYEYAIIPNGDHNFNLPQAQTDILNVLCRFVERSQVHRSPTT